MKKQKFISVTLFFFFQIGIFLSVFAQNMPMFCREFKVGGGARPDVASLPNGNFVICWEGSWHHVFAQLFDRNGVPASEIFQASTTPSDEHPEPRVASQANGNFLICWEVYKEGEIRNSDVYGQLFSQDGVPLGPEFIACSNPVENWSQRECDVVALNNGDFIAAWMSYNEDGFMGGIFGQRFTCNGEPVGEQFQLNNLGADAWEMLVSLASYGYDGFTAVWHRERINWGQGHDFIDIGFQRFDGDNAYVWTEKTVNKWPLSGFGRPVVTTLRDSSIIVCWNYSSNFRDETVCAQKFDKYGNPAGPSFNVNSSYASMALELGIATLNSGDFVVCWRHHTQAIREGEEVSYLEIRAQIFNEATEKVGGEFKVNAISGEDLRHNYPSVIAHGDSGFVVVWMEKWSTVYGKVFSTDSINVWVEEEPPLPEDFTLHRNFPNPFSDVATIPYSLPERERWYYVKIHIYNSMGARVKTLRCEYQTGGHHFVEWDGKDSNGTVVANGVYFCQFNVSGAVKTSKLIFVR